jgi:hypothetical protein
MGYGFGLKGAIEIAEDSGTEVPLPRTFFNLDSEDQFAFADVRMTFFVKLMAEAGW